MRPERTKAEVAALIALENAIAMGERPKHALEQTDAPDAILRLKLDSIV